MPVPSETLFSDLVNEGDDTSLFRPFIVGGESTDGFAVAPVTQPELWMSATPTLLSFVPQAPFPHKPVA